MTQYFKSMAAIALVITLAPMSGVPLVRDMFGSGYAHAAGKSGEDHGSSGDRGNSSGDRGNSGGGHGNSAGNQGGSDATSDDKPGNRSEVHKDQAPKAKAAKAAREPNDTAMAGAANAAHASVQGLLHASPNSTVGRLKTYADLTYDIQTEFGTALDEAQAAFDDAYPDFDTLTDDEQAAALASPEGIALDEAEQDLASAQTKADAAFARVAKNPESQTVRNYVDRLLSDYYDYLAHQ